MPRRPLPLTERSTPRDTTFQLSLEGLPVELRRLRETGLYWVDVSNTAQQMQLLYQIISTAPIEARGLLASTTDPANWLKGARLNHIHQDIRLFQLGPKKEQALDSFTRDLDRAFRPKERTLLLCLPSDYAMYLAYEGNALLGEWKAWLGKNRCTLVILACNEAPQALEQQLLPLNHIIAGISRLTTEPDTYHVMYWRSSLNVMGSHAFTLRQKNQRLEVQPITEVHHETATAHANRSFLFEKKAVERLGLRVADDWKVFDSRSALYEQALTETTATVIFSLNALADLPEIARMLHTLRLQRGNRLKLVVLELSTPLRHLDAERLLDCGASYVIPSGTPLPRILSLLESMQSLSHDRPLLSDPEHAFNPDTTERVRGIVSPAVFGQYIAQLLSSKEAIIPGVLICMTPVPGLRVEQILEELNLKRFDDIASALGDTLYVFLYGCHPHLVSVALNNLFRLPYRELFSRHTELSEREEIEGEYQRIRSSLEQLGPEQSQHMAQPASVQQRASHATHRPTHYAPQRITLTLRTEASNKS